MGKMVYSTGNAEEPAYALRRYIAVGADLRVRPW